MSLSLLWFNQNSECSFAVSLSFAPYSVTVLSASRGRGRKSPIPHPPPHIIALPVSVLLGSKGLPREPEGQVPFQKGACLLMHIGDRSNAL